jgi:hypothetical protein
MSGARSPPIPSSAMVNVIGVARPAARDSSSRPS